MPAQNLRTDRHETQGEEYDSRISESQSSSSLGRQATHALAAWQRFFGHSPHQHEPSLSKAQVSPKHGKLQDESHTVKHSSNNSTNQQKAKPAGDQKRRQADAQQGRDSEASPQQIGKDVQPQLELRPGTTQHNGVEHHLMKLAPLEEQAELVRHSPATTASTPTSPGRPISMVRQEAHILITLCYFRKICIPVSSSITKHAMLASKLVKSLYHRLSKLSFECISFNFLCTVGCKHCWTKNRRGGISATCVMQSLTNQSTTSHPSSAMSGHIWSDDSKVPSQVFYDSPHASGQKPSSRFGHASAVSNGKLFIFGGASSMWHSDSYVFNPGLLLGTLSLVNYNKLQRSIL